MISASMSSPSFWRESRKERAVETRKRPDFEGGVTEIEPVEVCIPELKAVSAQTLLSSELAPPLVLWGSADLPIVTAEDVSLLHAREGVGKSWIVFGLACSIAAGEPFLGIATVQVPVLLITAELSAYRARERLERIVERVPVSDQLHLITERELDGLDVLNPDHLNALTRLVKDLGVRLVALDPLAELWTGEEVNRDWQRLNRCLRRLRVKAACGVFLSHHEAKGENPRALKGKHADQNAFRGGTVLRAGVRSALRMEDHSEGLVRLAHTKSNLGPRHETLWLDVTEPWAPKLTDPANDRSSQKLDNLDAVQRILEKHARTEMTVSEISLDPNCPRVQRDTLRKYLATLVEEDRAQHNGGRGVGSKYSTPKG
jgi:hypothetical protein